MCVDGPSGAGKTQLAARLVGALGGPPLLRMDDLYPGWDGLAAGVEALRRDVVAPLAEGRPARYRRWDWTTNAHAETQDLGTPPVLVVEGVGAGAVATPPLVEAGAVATPPRVEAGAVATPPLVEVSDGATPALVEVGHVVAPTLVGVGVPGASLLVWLDAAEEIRHRRAMERDGATYAPHWARWAAQERAHFAVDRTRDRADVAFCFR